MISLIKGCKDKCLQGWWADNLHEVDQIGTMAVFLKLNILDIWSW